MYRYVKNKNNLYDVLENNSIIKSNIDKEAAMQLCQMLKSGCGFCGMTPKFITNGDSNV